jgi:ferric-dicitrate binding protein FerR (iron transport regulator)
MPISVSRIQELMADAPPDPHADLAVHQMAARTMSQMVDLAMRQTVSRAASQMAGLAWSQLGSQAACLAVTQAANTMKSLQETQRTQEGDRSILGPTVVLGVNEHTRAEAEARRATSELRALALQHRDALHQVRRESEAAARRYFWKGVAATVLVGALLAVASWLLNALNAAQVLSALFHR